MSAQMIQAGNSKSFNAYSRRRTQGGGAAAKAIQQGNAASFHAYVRPGMQEGGLKLSRRKSKGVIPLDLSSMGEESNAQEGFGIISKGLKTIGKVGKVAGTGLKIAGKLTGDDELKQAGKAVKTGSKVAGTLGKGAAQVGLGATPGGYKPVRRPRPMPRPKPGGAGPKKQTGAGRKKK